MIWYEFELWFFWAMIIAHRAMSISYIKLNPMYELWSYHDNRMNPMYELWSYHDNGFIIDELCYIISSMTFIMTPKKEVKDVKVSLILWCQGSFALLRCFFNTPLTRLWAGGCDTAIDCTLWYWFAPSGVLYFPMRHPSNGQLTSWQPCWSAE